MNFDPQLSHLEAVNADIESSLTDYQKSLLEKARSNGLVLDLKSNESNANDALGQDFVTSNTRLCVPAGVILGGRWAEKEGLDGIDDVDLVQLSTLFDTSKSDKLARISLESSENEKKTMDDLSL